jgi:tRNA U34 2-thiouridine synthase MnmA/TrmU
MKAIALISGGLDSILAGKLIEQQGVEVIYLHFNIPFCHKDKEEAENAIVSNFNIRIKAVDISRDFLEMIKNPEHGYGSNMNPCIDCKILMLRKAKELLAELGASFVVTGEVLGQRPMSQHRKAMVWIEEKSGLNGLLLRPLCAQRFPETIPEKQGWIDRGKLKDFNGRERANQKKLAVELGIEKYPNPAGGCLLTDLEFSNRLRELISRRELSIKNVELLKIGRHFRFSSGAKLVVGRHQKENEKLGQLASDGDCLIYPTQEMAGPTGLLGSGYRPEEIDQAAKIICGYCDLNGKIKASLLYRIMPREEEKPLEPAAIKREEFATFRV